MMFSPKDLAILIPTKDRSEKMRELLQSIESQNFELNQIVIVASGRDVSFLKNEFSRLPIDYHHTECTGQINQRNYGIQKLRPEVQLVCLFDDDHYLLPGALQTMLDFWNREPNHGAVCFNIVDEPPFRWNFFKYIFCMTGTKPGQVTRAGCPTRITNVSQNIQTKWVMGGATVWKRTILEEHPHQDWDKGFPENEDVFFSFPLSQKYNFVVCAEAKAEHRRITLDHFKTMELGAIEIRRRFGLVRRLPSLSIPLAYWASCGRILENSLRALLHRDLGYLKMGLGNIRALIKQLL